MKVFGLINRNSGPGFHRIMIPLLGMRDTDCYITNGIEEKDFDERRPDAIFYNRIISDEIILMQKKYHFKIVVDVDDYWYLDPKHIMYKYNKEERFPVHQEKHIQLADAVTTTNERLAEIISRFNKNVVVCPNAIPKNMPEYFPVERTTAANDMTRVFWQGSVTHEGDIKMFAPTVKRLPRKKFMMVIAGVMQDEVVWYRIVKLYTNDLKQPGSLLPGRPVVEYYQNYKYADICVVPLLSTRFNSFKSNLKILEAAHSGLPVIASNVHPYKDMIGVMYVNEKNDWYKWLMEDKAVWEEHATALKEYCDKHFNFETINETRRTAIA